MNYNEEELKKYNEAYLKKYLPKEKLEAGLQRLENGEPVQYIVGNVDFYGFLFDIDKRVLIPRFETEELVEKTIQYISAIFDEPISILDLGTGSGCIAITLKKKIPSAMVVALDISSAALEVAKQNALKLDAEVTLLKSDLFQQVSGSFDVIISNPPYIAYEEEIMDIVSKNEPQVALYAPNQGLYYYEEILKQCSKYLKDRFLIAFEIGQTQGDQIALYAHHYLGDVEVSVEKDMRGLDRFVFIKKR